MSYIIDVMKRHLKNKNRIAGRTCRKDFWTAIALSTLVYLFLWTFYIVYTLLLAWLEVNPENLTFFLAIIAVPFGIIEIDLLWAFCAAVSRRLHDVGAASGYAALGVLFPIGTIVLLIFLCRASDEDNQYGSSA